MILGYKVVEAAITTELEKRVNLMIKEGWQPLGPPSVYHTGSTYANSKFLQVMTRSTKAGVKRTEEK